MTNEALIGEHNMKLLLTGYKALIGIAFWVISQLAIIQVHSYDILVINTHPCMDLQGYHTYPRL